MSVRPSEYAQALEIVHRNAEQLARIVDALVAAAGTRRPGCAEPPTRIAVGVRAASCAASRRSARSTSRSTSPAAAVRLGVDADLAERILQPVLENACRYGAARCGSRSSAAIRPCATSVADDGPGVDDDERETIFEPGIRGGAGEAGEFRRGRARPLARPSARAKRRR